MKNYIVYKVVCEENGLYRSTIARADLAYTYAIGVKQVSTTPIFVFDRLSYAQDYAFPGNRILECTTTNKPRPYDRPLLPFWQLLNKNEIATREEIEAFWKEVFAMPKGEREKKYTSPYPDAIRVRIVFNIKPIKVIE